MKNTNPTPDLLIREEERPIPIEKESPEVITGDKTEITDNNQTIRNTTPDIPKQGQKADSGSQGNSGSNEQPSPWSITIMATNSGVDAGISYRLLQLALLKETDLDLVIGIKQAGIGLSKYVSGNFGLGLIGTVAYGNGDKNLGIYGKYSF